MTPPPSRTPLIRRDFLFGSVAGLTAGAGGWLLAPAKAHEAFLPQGSVVSYAQNGEDLVLDSIFRVLNIDKPSYMDIGAYEPIVGSNTYLFWKKGARGVLIEPNPDLTKNLQSKRPGDLVLPIGIGVDDTPEADFYMCSWPQLNTFDKESADNIAKDTQGQAQITKVIKVPLVNINKIIAEKMGGQAPDLLSIDAEGFDIYILKSLDFAKYRPAVIITEHSQNPKEYQEMLDLLASQNYSVRGLTFVNTILVDNQRLSRD